MAAESKNANIIAGNLEFQLRLKLGDDHYNFLHSDVRLSVIDHQVYRYPDFVLVSQADQRDIHYVFEPVLVAEVTSDESERRDRGPKLKEYKKIASLQFYLIIAQDEIYIELYARNGGRVWHNLEFTLMDEVITFPSLGVEIPVSVIYKNVLWPKGEQRQDSL